MRIRVLVLVGFLVMAVSFIGALPAAASCVMPEGSLGERLANDRYVFVGTVDAVRNGARLAEVTVESVWRGNVEDAVEVAGGTLRPGSFSSVDRTYKAGQRYLFASYDKRGARYLDNVCSDTRRWTPKLDRLRPEGAPPVNGPPSSEEPQSTEASEDSAEPSAAPMPVQTSSGVSATPWIAGTAVAAVAAVAVVGRRRRS